MIQKEITIEELVRIVPESVSYLMDKGIRCLACGEPIWGTFEEAALQRGYTHDEIETMVAELSNQYHHRQEENSSV